MSLHSRLALVLALVGAVGCGEPPAEPTAPTLAPAADPAVNPSPDAARLEGIARRMARALKNPSFRSYVKSRLDESPFPEHKIHLTRFLEGEGGRGLRAVAQENGEADTDVDTALHRAVTLEAYLPAPEHRRAWTGDERLLVATELKDGDIPVAFDLNGGRHFLSPDRPPETPVLAVVPVETNFDRVPGPAGVTCTQNCGGGGGGGSPSAPGLYMTYSHFVQDFEGWLKGNPEFEIHMLGQAGASDSVTDYQCAGEHAGGLYTFDQNGLDWNGSVLLYSQAQLDQYKAQHPGQSLRVFALEDDDGACQIKLDGNRVGALFSSLGVTFGGLTAGRDSATKFARIWKKAPALINFFKSVWSLITTSDDLIGTAIEDTVVGQSYPGANWVVRGENNVTNGWLKLIMK